MIWPIKIFEIIKFVTSAINENATIILAIITGVYAYFTYRMATIMKKQVIADIEVTNMVLGSNFSESWFLKRLKDQFLILKRWNIKTLTLILSKKLSLI